ncbi:hypothetical protein CJF42_16125 [Pseudoalteromonas sp. NBT06-2]|uniref:hypothetical protein n=1 Tax=Pseudoalteromonas sp. NBT06-2 TaxID=2025950 RepID=UPI000BA5D382|nr:hypothetical protein [Pseudoalteromonas sp. NBT06-2]PAJ73391.1 hypothetical protein CJF42_16125 [Pseudoalteromonas sp. NBT06-2]
MDITIWLKIIGAIFTGVGSILLAWRVKSILTWVKNCLIAHEVSIRAFQDVVNGNTQKYPVVTGTIIHLLDIESKLGVILLVSGFIFLAMGMFFNAASYFFI